MCLGVIREKQSSYLAVRPKSDATRVPLTLHAALPLASIYTSSMRKLHSAISIETRWWNANLKGHERRRKWGASTVRMELKTVNQSNQINHSISNLFYNTIVHLKLNTNLERLKFQSVKILSYEYLCTKYQCGKFIIFQSLRFYVKSILENLKVLNMSFLPI